MRYYLSDGLRKMRYTSNVIVYLNLNKSLYLFYSVITHLKAVIIIVTQNIKDTKLV